jgi:hypothetical protein
VLAQVAPAVPDGTIIENPVSAGSDQVNADISSSRASASLIVQNPVPIPVLLPLAAAGGGATQTFTFQFSDPGGWQNLSVANVLINSALDGRHGCYIAYVVPAATLVLVDDAGDDGGPFAGSVAATSSSAVQNNQCAVSLASPPVGAGNTLTLTLKVTFSASFGGNKITYVAARNSTGFNSDWQALGVWQVPASASAGNISVTGVSPARITSTSGASQTITATINDSKGAADLGIVNVLVNSSLDGRQSCYLAYVASTKTLILVNDQGDAGGNFAGSITLNGSGTTIQNSQCKVSGFGSSAAVSGNVLQLTLNVTFFSNFGGNRIVYVAARDAANGNNTDWQPVATWTVQ